MAQSLKHSGINPNQIKYDLSLLFAREQYRHELEKNNGLLFDHQVDQELNFILRQFSIAFEHYSKLDSESVLDYFHRVSSSNEQAK